MAKQSAEKKILETLDKILRALSLQIAPEKSITERVRLLKLAGIDNKTIAKVLNISQASVRALASQSRKRTKK